MLLIASILMTIGAVLGTLAFIGIGILISVLWFNAHAAGKQKQLKLDLKSGDDDASGPDSA